MTSTKRGILTCYLAILAFGAVALPVSAQYNPSPNRSAWELPPINPDSPLFDQLFASVKVDSDEVTGRGFKEGDEILNCAYAYLHEQSPHRYDPAYRDRLLALMQPRFEAFNAGKHRNDIAFVFQTMYAYMLLKKHRPEDVEQFVEAWDQGARSTAEYIMYDGRSHVFTDQILGGLWLNGDIRLGLASYFAGVAIEDPQIQDVAASAINDVMTQAVIGDGATHYVGFNNESQTYHNVTISCMTWWWTLTGSPKMKEALDKTINYVPLSVEPSGFQEQSTAIPYKHVYNGIRGRHAALLKAYLSGDGYNYAIGKEVENTSHPEQKLLHAIHYRDDLEAWPLPNNFILHDRAILGPRGRFGDWGFVANGRNPQTPGPEHQSQGYEGGMCGKNTFVGAFTLGPMLRNGSLNAALDTVQVRFKQTKGEDTDWARGRRYRFLSQDEETTTLSRPTFGTLATEYRISERTSSGPTKTWGAGTDWLGRQLWLLTADRLVGLVQIHTDTDQAVYGLDTRAVLTSGRYKVSGERRELIETEEDSYEFGDMRLRIVDNSFEGDRKIKRFGITNNSDDDFAVQIVLADRQDNGTDAEIKYPAGTTRWAIIEAMHKDASWSEPSVNVLPDDSTWAVLDVRETQRSFRLIHNLTDRPQRYRSTFKTAYRSSSLQADWLEGGMRSMDSKNGSVWIDEVIPPYNQAALICSENETDHHGDAYYYEDIFTREIR
ncbi:MAG: hypothetical protein AAGI37_13140 [Planctomycetota bacterium]